MFQRLLIGASMIAELERMFDDLGEPQQVLVPTSNHPLVVHHTVGQLSLVTRGKGLASLGGQEIELNVGDFLILAPGCEHAFYAPDGELVLRHWHWPQTGLSADRHIVKETFTFSVHRSATQLAETSEADSEKHA